MARQQLADDPRRLVKLLQALDRYGHADRSFLRQPGTVLLQHGKAMLRSAAGTPAPDASTEPQIVFVPSSINAPHVLDMDADCSLIGWLGKQRMPCALIDWGTTTPDHRDHDLDHLATRLLLPMLRAIGRPVHLVGYCLGGMIAMAAACHIEVRSLTLIATPWNFSGYTAKRREELTAMWQHHRAACEAMGLVPMEVMQHGFWTLSPDKLMEKYLKFGAMPEGSASARRFVAVEDWANGGEPLPFALGAQLFEQLYRDDRSGKGEWMIDGITIAPDQVRGPVMEFASASDAIVPLACSPDIPGREVLASGHVGMVIGGSAPTTLWPMLRRWILSHEAST